DLLHKVAGSYEFLRDIAGLIRTYTYHAPTGFPASESIQQGQLGSSIKLREYEYVACCGNSSSSSSSSSSPSSSSPTPGPCVHFLAQEISYPSDGCSSSSSSSSSSPLPQIITRYDYIFCPGTCAVQPRTTTLPVIPAEQNGSGIAATRREYFDIY